MTAAVLSGRDLAARIRSETAARAAALAGEGRPPGLAIVVASADESSAWYVRSLAKTAEQTGVSCAIRDLGPQAPVAAIRAALAGR